MIKGKSYALTLAYCEIAALERHLESTETLLEIFTCGASYAASSHGVTIYCVSGKQAEKIWDAVLLATDVDEEDSK